MAVSAAAERTVRAQRYASAVEILAAAVAAVTTTVVTLAILLWRVHGKLRDTTVQLAAERETGRADAVKRSRTGHLARIAEQVAPLLPDFPYDLKDFRSIGGDVDAIVFDGLEAGADIEVVFLDIKHGPRAGLTPTQRRIREAIKAGRVRFETYKPCIPAPPELPASEVIPAALPQ
jgi:predicted Holliday junction resolvase-like endonuclease